MGIDFKLSDENVLTLSSIGVGAYGAGYFFAPDKAQVSTRQTLRIWIKILCAARSERHSDLFWSRTLCMKS